MRKKISKVCKVKTGRNDKWRRLGRRPTYEEEVKEITKEEWDYYKRKNLEVPPEQRYQKQKETLGISINQAGIIVEKEDTMDMVAMTVYACQNVDSIQKKDDTK